jgi:ABC-type antimicrobial peptide transport system permease subunit
MVGLSAVGAGALVGLLIGIGLSVYVALLDARKRTDGLRSRAQYRGSIVVVPTLLAVLGGLLAAGVTKLG